MLSFLAIAVPVGAAMIGMRAASSNLGKIVGWAVLAASVGLVLPFSAAGSAMSGIFNAARRF